MGTTDPVSHFSLEMQKNKFFTWIFAVKRFFVCENSKTAIRNEVLAMAEALKEHPLHYKKELRFNKSLADTNGALVLNGA